MIPTKKQYDEAMLISAARKNFRDIYVRKAVENGIDENIAHAEYSKLICERLARNQEKILLNGGYGEMPVLVNREGQIISYKTIVIELGEKRIRCWHILPEFVSKYKKFVCVGNKSRDIKLWNFRVAKALIPVKITVKSNSIHYLPNLEELKVFYEH